MTHVGRMIHITGGPPGMIVEITPLTNWVNVAAPVFPTMSLAVRRRMVPTGIAMIAYRPGRGAGIKAVVNPISEDRVPKRDMRATFFEVKNRSFMRYFSVVLCMDTLY